MNLRGILLGMGLFFAVLVVSALYADVASLQRALVSYPLWMVLPACGLVLCNYALRTVRFRIYLRALGIRVVWREALLIFVGGIFFSVSPGKMGEVFKGYLLHKRHGAHIADSATVVVAERFTDVVALLCLAAVGVSQYGAHVGLFFSVFLLCLGFLAAVAHPRLIPGVVRRIEPRLAQHPRVQALVASVIRIHTSLRVLCQPRWLILGIALASGAWGFECVALRLLFEAAGGGGGMGGTIVIYAMATLFGAVSMLPGGVGTTEAVMIALALQPAFGLRLSLPEVTLVTLLIRFCTLWFGVALGGLSLVAMRHIAPRSEISE